MRASDKYQSNYFHGLKMILPAPLTYTRKTVYFKKMNVLHVHVADMLQAGALLFCGLLGARINKKLIKFLCVHCGPSCPLCP